MGMEERRKKEREMGRGGRGEEGGERRGGVGVTDRQLRI